MAVTGADLVCSSSKQACARANIIQESRWQSFTVEKFGELDKRAFHEYAATEHDRKFDCDSCDEIQFINKDGETLLKKTGSGHMDLPAGIRVVARRGSTKCS